MRTTIQRKINQINALANNPPTEIINALSSLGETFDSKDIRSSLEEREIQTINKFIQSFSVLPNTINNMLAKIDSLDHSIDSMLEKLSIGDKGVEEVLDKTASLHSQQENQRQQLNSIHNFIDKYYLQNSDLQILNSGDINDQFFESFSRLEAAQLRTTEALKSHDSICFQEISDSLNKIKENAFQRMHTWLHMNSHLFDSVHPMLNASYGKCLQAIKQKPFLYGFVVEEISKVRGSVVGRAFLKALTTGDSDTKPIEASASLEPLQFVSDLFAWMHQTSATEASFLSNLLKEEPSSKVMKNALATVFDASVRPLEIRVSQVTKTLMKPSDLHQVANLCSFFSNIFGDMCGLTSTIYKCIDTLKQTATERFKQSINDSMNDISTNGKPTQGSIKIALRTISEITSLHKQSSLSTSFDVSVLIDSYAEKLLHAILTIKDSIAFQASSLYELLVICKDAKLQCETSVGNECNELLHKIILIEVNDILKRSRITETLLIIENKSDQPLSTVRGLEPESMQSAIKRFENSLVATGPIITPLCDTIQNIELKQKARKEVVEHLVKVYDKLFGVVMDPNNGYNSPGSMFKYTPDLLRDLISV
ncbi:conserved oligomeric Golgi complex subunit 6-like [Histomonas meleagridis]|uniref:conserved oligomeric Golgi complex subunit 6-like n=1 Tax=Histomonas meleagridis TaxID=135588 RepID=UPI0035594FB7|nr:conserved oligomeric Golgi complex subunit 6-like [Histomonas meleagridis]KAH0800889.1 conserved oligomeric Golgi complex subunit 6-like [Histomonas meleagridis]